jgi:Ca2+-dependent lipid-binding protein
MLIKTIRWITRIISIILFIILILYIVTKISKFNLLTQKEILILLSLIVVCCGLVISYVKELAGSIIILISTLLYGFFSGFRNFALITLLLISFVYFFLWRQEKKKRV